MKRLLGKLVASTLKAFKYRRLMRYAEFVDVEATDPNLVQNVTNVMSTGGKIEILYTDGQWRTIFPYGWNSSKDGNVLIMCYKDTGEIRSYRLDRIQQVRMDDSNLSDDSMMGVDQQFDVPEDSSSEFNVPQDLGTDTQEVERELPFDDALQVLNTEAPPEEIPFKQEEMNNENQEEPKSAMSRLRKRRLIS